MVDKWLQGLRGSVHFEGYSCCKENISLMGGVSDVDVAARIRDAWDSYCYQLL